MICNWSVKKLGDLVKFTSGGTPSKSNEAYWGGDIPWISASSMDSTRYSESELKVTTEGAKNGTRLVPKDTVLLLVRGGALHNKIPVGITTREVTFNQDVKALVPKTDEITPWYLLFWLISVKKTLLAKVENTGIGAGKLDTKILQELEVPLPPKPELKRLEKFCKALDDKIILNADTNQTLEQMAQAIFKSWFVDFDPVKAKMNGEQPEGMDAVTASLFPEKLIESELGLIPEGWEVKPFKKVVDKYVDNRGKTPPVVEDGIPLVEVKHLPENSAFPKLNTDKRVTEETFDTWFRVHVEPKDILISTVGTIGRTSFVKNTNFGIAQNVLGLRFGKVVEPEYMFYTIKAQRFQHDMDVRLVTTVQSSIKRKDLDTIDILVPPSNIQKEFCKLIGSLLEGQYSKNAENIELASLRDTLLPKLLSGEIELETLELEA